MLIEDVACPVDKLPDMMIDLIEMFEKYEYHDASCFGHALEGNLHLVFSQVRLLDTVQDTVSDTVSAKYEHHDALCLGHALEGNLHLVFSQVCRCC